MGLVLVWMGSHEQVAWAAADKCTAIQGTSTQCEFGSTRHCYVGQYACLTTTTQCSSTNSFTCSCACVDSNETGNTPCSPGSSSGTSTNVLCIQLTATPTPSPTPTATPPGTGSTPTPVPTPSVVTLSVSPYSQQYGNVVVNYTGAPVISHTFTFKNQGSTQATGCSVNLGGSNQFSFITDNCGPGGAGGGSLAIGGSCTVVVAGSPSMVYTQTATLSMTCTGTGGGSASASLSESGVNWPSFYINPSTVNFGDLSPGASASPVPIIITNAALPNTLQATGCSVTVSPDFSVLNGSNCLAVGSGGNCSVGLTATAPMTSSQPIYYGTITISCTGVSDTNYPTLSSPPSPFVGQSTPLNGYQFETACANSSQFIPAGDTNCQCPPGYELTTTKSEGLSCRPVLPSIEFYKSNNTTDSNSDGYPVCGTGRFPTAANYNIFDYATQYTPVSISQVSYMSGTGYYNYAYPGSAPIPNPVYLYSSATRCVCGNGYVETTESSGSGTQLSPTNASYVSQGQVRFTSDYFETINAQTNTIANATLPYGEVPMATDGVSNGYLGSVYYNGNAACTCPNVNEVGVPIDPAIGSQTGMVCKTMLDLSDATTNNYHILSTYNPSIHVQGTQKFSGSGAEPTQLKLPSVTGQNYQNYNRKIWTCAPPLQSKFSSNKIDCVFKPNLNICDDGSTSGIPSVVSANLHCPNNGASCTAKQRFDNAVNKRLACCLNDFDPTNPSAPEKFDCEDNSTTSYSTFDALWSSTDKATGKMPNGIELTNAAGQPVTGFYQVNGTRCSQYSEFAGTIQSMRINPTVTSAQQNLVGGTGQALGYTIYQPAWALADLNWYAYLGKKSVPSSIPQMLQCPILVRAAMKTTCPGSPLAANSAYPSSTPVLAPVQSFNDGTTTRCAAASQINIYLRIEQIYEITGQTKMTTIDAVANATQAISLPVSDWIRSKTAGACPTGALLMSDGTCAFQ